MSIATISNYKDWPYAAQERQSPSLPPLPSYNYQSHPS